LDIFIGKWINEGRTIPAADEPEQRILTSDVYEWVPGGFFVLHLAYGRIGDIDVGGVEIIGYDAAAGMYRTHFYDSRGGVTTEELSVEGDTWSWLGESTRATAVFDDAGKTQTVRHVPTRQRLGCGASRR
jgi:hypothetical protein